jgi:hypothetical protein
MDSLSSEDSLSVNEELPAQRIDEYIDNAITHISHHSIDTSYENLIEVCRN